MFQQFDFIVPQSVDGYFLGDLRLSGEYVPSLNAVRFERVTYRPSYKTFFTNETKDVTEFFQLMIDTNEAYYREMKECVIQHCEKHQTA